MNSGGVAELAGRVRWGASGFDPYVGLRFVHCSHPCWPMAHREAWGVINQVKTFVVLACILASSSSHSRRRPLCSTSLRLPQTGGSVVCGAGGANGVGVRGNGGVGGVFRPE